MAEDIVKQSLVVEVTVDSSKLEASLAKAEHKIDAVRLKAEKPITMGVYVNDKEGDRIRQGNLIKRRIAESRKIGTQHRLTKAFTQRFDPDKSGLAHILAEEQRIERAALIRKSVMQSRQDSLNHRLEAFRSYKDSYTFNPDESPLSSIAIEENKATISQGVRDNIASARNSSRQYRYNEVFNQKFNPDESPLIEILEKEAKLLQEIQLKERLIASRRSATQTRLEAAFSGQKFDPNESPLIEIATKESQLLDRIQLKEKLIASRRISTLNRLEVAFNSQKFDPENSPLINIATKESQLLDRIQLKERLIASRRISTLNRLEEAFSGQKFDPENSPLIEIVSKENKLLAEQQLKERLIASRRISTQARLEAAFNNQKFDPNESPLIAIAQNEKRRARLAQPKQHTTGSRRITKIAQADSARTIERYSTAFVRMSQEKIKEIREIESAKRRAGDFAKLKSNSGGFGDLKSTILGGYRTFGLTLGVAMMFQAAVTQFVTAVFSFADTMAKVATGLHKTAAYKSTVSPELSQGFDESVNRYRELTGLDVGTISGILAESFSQFEGSGVKLNKEKMMQIVENAHALSYVTTKDYTPQEALSKSAGLVAGNIAGREAGIDAYKRGKTVSESMNKLTKTLKDMPLYESAFREKTQEYYITRARSAPMQLLSNIQRNAPEVGMKGAVSMANLAEDTTKNTKFWARVMLDFNTIFEKLNTNGQFTLFVEKIMNIIIYIANILADVWVIIAPIVNTTLQAIEDGLGYLSLAFDDLAAFFNRIYKLIGIGSPMNTDAARIAESEKNNKIRTDSRNTEFDFPISDNRKPSNATDESIQQRMKNRNERSVNSVTNIYGNVINNSSGATTSQLSFGAI